MEEKERLKKHLEYLCSFDKLTGEPEALQAVAYISDVLKKYGVSCHTETFPAYLSNPVKSVLTVDGKEIPSRPRSFSESTGKSLHVPLVYDPGTREAVSMDRQKQFLENVSGKLVLGYGYDERYAKIYQKCKDIVERAVCKNAGTVWSCRMDPDLDFRRRCDP